MHEQTYVLAKWQSHKVVQAARIIAILDGRQLVFADNQGFYYPPTSYFAKHEPTVGGYFVEYEDGYQSFSPAKAFEDGYTLVE